MCIEKVVIRKSREELNSKTYQSPTVPQRIVLKPNLHYGRQDTTSFDARTSFDHPSTHKETCGGGTYNECCRGEIDFRIHRIAPVHRSRASSHPQETSSTVASSVRDASEWRSVASRPEAKSRVQPIQRAIEGNDLQHGKHGVLRDLKITPTAQCHNCVTYWTKGMENCVCGTCLRPSDKKSKTKQGSV